MDNKEKRDALHRERRHALIGSFNDTMNMYRQDIGLFQSVEHSKENTKVITDAQTEENKCDAEGRLCVTVTQQKTLDAAAEFHRSDEFAKTAVLNFASAIVPGGGVVFGSTAQEEYLCRCTTLYPCIFDDKVHDDYYGFHKNNCVNGTERPFLYSDRLIYTPDVVVIKDGVNIIPERLNVSDRFTVNVITCAAPNLRMDVYNKVTKEELFDIHVKRARAILSTARDNGNAYVVLGAFGCGAFKNNPEVVAKAYKKVLCEFKGVFKEIRFAVYDASTKKENYTVFNEILGKDNFYEG